MIDDINKIIFIHPIKSGGTSVEKAFGAQFVKKDHPRDQRPPVWVEYGRQVASAKYYREKYPKEWETYRKIATIRPPWQRLLSWHRYALKSDTMYADLGAALRESGVELRDGVWEPYFRKQCADAGMRSLVKLLPEDSELDFILRTEHLAEDFPKMVEALGIPGTLPIEHKNANPLVSANWTDFFTPEMAAAVAEQYEEEIVRFGFSYPALPGDLIARVTKALGIERCDGCEGRRKALNQAWQRVFPSAKSLP